MNWGAFAWPNGRSRPRGGWRRGGELVLSSTAGSKKRGFWCKINIHEARKLGGGGGRLFGRKGGRGRRIRFCMQCAAFGSRPASGSTAGSKKLGFWCKINIHTLMNNIHDLTHPYVMNSVSTLKEISRILGNPDRFRVIFEK